MKRRLIIMRHAKSSWTSGAMTDHQRPLNARGRRDAPRMAEALVQRDWVPDAVLSSDAARTQETWDRMSAVLPPGLDPEFTHGLYHADVEAFIRHTGRTGDGAACLLALGHNPGLEQVVAFLCGQVEQMTTANCALLVGSGATWTDALESRWELISVLRPKEL